MSSLLSRGVRGLAISLGVAVLGALLPTAALAKAHLWRFSEFFSNSDGSVQFIEMQECCGSSVEVNLRTWDLHSNANTYIFPNGLTGDTAYQHLLLATQSFADLPGAPTPDFIIPPQFFDPAGDTLTYRTVDTVTIPAHTMPVNGTDSIDRSLAVHTNDPTNFAGITGSVVAPFSVPMLWPPALVVLALALTVAGWVSSRRSVRRSA
jgi:hypothetical protein